MYPSKHSALIINSMYPSKHKIMLITLFCQIDREIRKLIFLRIQHAARHSSNHFRQNHEISRVARRRAKASASYPLTREESSTFVRRNSEIKFTHCICIYIHTKREREKERKNRRSERTENESMSKGKR